MVAGDPIGDSMRKEEMKRPVRKDENLFTKKL